MNKPNVPGYIFRYIRTLGALFWLLLSVPAFGAGFEPLHGIWVFDEDYQITELLFRPDGKYQRDTRSTMPDINYSFSERGRYSVAGQRINFTSFEFIGEPEGQEFNFSIAGGTLVLESVEFGYTETYQFKPGSKEDVIARQGVPRNLIGKWERPFPYGGTAEYLFRPGGVYMLKNTSDGNELPPEYIRGRYETVNSELAITPYSGVEAVYEMDFFGDELTLIRNQGTSGDSLTFTKIPGSAAEVQAKSAEAEAFLSSENWQVGLWEIREPYLNVDLVVRPDGHYSAENKTEFLKGIVRGRYNLGAGQIGFLPFPGQGIYAPSNGDFGKVDHILQLDYYNGELQFINLAALSQTVYLARKVAGSKEAVLQASEAAQQFLQEEGWQIGIWVVNDPSGWLEFTFRPDGRYIAKSGSGGVPGFAEQGRYVIRNGKITLAPYIGLGPARAFELDYYTGDLFLSGDLNRMVIARKVAGSRAEVEEKTAHPAAMEGELGGILGLWTANRPGLNSELVFRPDGQFRLTHCNGTETRDYGLYTVNMASRTLVYDSRFSTVQTLGLDFYGNTLTLHDGLGGPLTYTVNLGVAAQAIAASHAADDAEAAIDTQWLAKTPVAPRNPNATQIPTAEIPADPNPGHIFNSPDVFSGYQLYRRLIPTFVYFNVNGRIESVAVVNTREWHFFPTGRVLTRFRNYSAAVYPNTFEDISDTWGAYRIEPKPTSTDILHIFADNSLFIESDTGERVEMTLEDGRRHLFWGKDYQILSSWASEQKPVPCELPPNPDPSLANAGLSLSSNIAPDPTEEARPVLIGVTLSAQRNLSIQGNTEAAGEFVLEGKPSLAESEVWTALSTNAIPAGAFEISVTPGATPAQFFRLRTK